MPFPSPEDLPDPEIEPKSPALAGGSFTAEPPGKPLDAVVCVLWAGMDYDMHIRVVLTGKLFAIFKN